MLHHCTRTILAELNRYIQAKLGLNTEPVSLVILGKYPGESKGKSPISMRLMDLVPVEVCSNPNEYVQKGDGFVVRTVPKLFTLYFLFSVDYDEKNILGNIELLSYVAAFFQYKPYFDVCNTPSLQEVGMENFSVELVKPTTSEKSTLWATLNLPYVPSLLYKVGLISVGDATMGGKVVAPFVSL